jgi:catechol 2,3-dioxygenase-like lactoylglutathione lyase family enzyme
MSPVSVRYIVNDVDEAIAFYTELLGFEVVMRPAPPFAMLSRGDMRLLLSAPSGQGGGGQILEGGRAPEPGGWNRFQIQVEDVAAEVERLKAAGANFRRDVLIGVGGDQALLEDPSGNAIELFQPKF